MYNLHIATKIKNQLKKQRLHHLKQHQYLQKYTNQVQPKLLDSYNKRINTFMRKMEENPIVLTRFDQNQFAPHRLFRNLNDKEKFLGSEFFRFKDHNDWNSIYTEAERSQRKMNERYMEQKFGDSTLAYRSIVSQSEYTPSSKHEFRFRLKQKQINPPMKYVCSVPKIMIRKLKSKNNTIKLRTQGGQQVKNRNSKKETQTRSKQNKSLMTKTSNLIDQDNRSVKSFKSTLSFPESVVSKNESQNNQENEQQRKQKQQKKYMSPKMHFKTLIQTFQQTPDYKVKQNMRQVLVKCGIFRNKDKRAIPESEVDRFSLLIDNNLPSTNIPQHRENLPILKQAVKSK